MKMTEHDAAAARVRRSSVSWFSTGDLTRAQFAIALIVIVLAAACLRMVFPAADPPSHPGIGVVWHDEGGWVHNARNRALFGSWKTDEWNPMYMTPVLTGLEYLAFRVLGVGLRQARAVSELLGVLSVCLIGLGVARLGNRLAGLIAAALLATNFVYVMYDRAATMEATMVALLVLAWYGYVRAGDSPRWGLLAGAAAILAYFTKASAVFFLAALGLDALLVLGWAGRDAAARPARRAALVTLAGLAAAGAIAAVVFLVPNWHEYRFYNWQVAITRKPSYSLGALVSRASWLPIVPGVFTRMWLLLVVAGAAMVGALTRVLRLPAAERLLLWWVGLGVAEVVVYDVLDRRLVPLIPALVAIAALAFGRDRSLAPEPGRASPWPTLAAAPVVFYALYLAAGSVVRLAFLEGIGAGRVAAAVRVSAAVAILLGCALYATRRRTTAWLARQRWAPAASLLLVALVATGDIAQFVQWASGRSYKNYEAMRQVGRWLPPGTVVQGKLANGLALESRIRPLFVGNHFGNYADRCERDDVRYLATYVAPMLAYEGGRDESGRPLVLDILEAYPGHRVVRAFAVEESPGDNDVAVLIDKMPEAKQPPGRAHAEAKAKGAGAREDAR